MEHADLLRDILIRITLLLACGWLILFVLAARVITKACELNTV